MHSVSISRPRYDVWFAIPSASPERCRKVLPVWRKMGYKTAILQNYERGDIPADVCVWSDTYPGWPGSINILCRDVVPRTAHVVVSGGDDMLPDPDHGAQELAHQMHERFPDGFGVMQPHGDTFMEARRYCGSPFLGRGWIDRMYRGSGPMCDQYRHNWADNELYWLAKGLGALWERPDLTHFHEHFTRDGSDKPAYWKSNVETKDLEDCRLYISRAWSRFPGHEPLNGGGVARVLDTSVLAQGALHLAEVRMALVTYMEAGRSAWVKAMHDALERCAREGLGPVAIYGAGNHTRSVSAALMEPPVAVSCVIDDNPAAQGGSLWGYPIVSREQAVGRGVRAVVLSANAHEGALFDNCGVFAENGIEVFRLYAPPAHEKVRRVGAALDALGARGVTRVALYGAGAHTADVIAAAVDPARPARCVCVIDDAPRPGGVIAGTGIPVVGMRDAAAMGVGAVILSSDRHERDMWERSAPLRAAGIEVVRLYTRTLQMRAAETSLRIRAGGPTADADRARAAAG